MSDHWVIKCSCGNTVSQCRCASPTKSITTYIEVCHLCVEKRWEQQNETQPSCPSRLDH